MRSLPLVLLLLLTLAPATQGALLQVDITYTNGQIISGPLSADLTELPESVLATFTLTGTTEGGYDLANVVEASLVFGDSAWGVSDLQSFTTLIVSDGGLLVASLTYDYAALDSAAVSDRIAGNFPLEIEGFDLATGEAFLYRYDTSSQAVTIVPEPSTCALALAGVLGVLVWRKRR